MYMYCMYALYLVQTHCTDCTYTCMLTTGTRMGTVWWVGGMLVCLCVCVVCAGTFVLELSGQCWFKCDVDALVQGLSQLSCQHFVLRPELCSVNRRFLKSGHT